MLFRGREVPGFALGAGPSFTQANLDLKNKVIAGIARGEQSYKWALQNLQLDYGTAVANYQAAGNLGATSVGPEINACGALGATSPAVLQAWTLGQQLAVLPKTGLPDSRNKIGPYYNRDDADAAYELVDKMVELYQQAIADGATALNQTPPTPDSVPAPPEPAPTQPAPTTSPWLVVLGIAVVGTAVTVVAFNTKYSKRRLAYV